MADNIRGERVIASCFGHLRVDNVDIAEVTNLDLTVEFREEEVQWGLDVDRKITGMAGSGTITVDKVYTRFVDIFESIQKGKDKRVDVLVTVKDPDAVNGQMETISITGMWFKDFGIGFGDKTTKGSKEYNVGFKPGQTNFVDKIK